MDEATTKLDEAKTEGWQYKVVYVDFRGRISVEGQETHVGHGDRSTAFVRRFLDGLGRDGWELVGVHPQMPPETAYFVFKKPGSAPVEQPKVVDEAQGSQPDQAQSEGQPAPPQVGPRLSA